MKTLRHEQTNPKELKLHARVLERFLSKFMEKNHGITYFNTFYFKKERGKKIKKRREKAMVVNNKSRHGSSR